MKRFIILIFMAGRLFAQQREIVAYFTEWGIRHQPYYVKHIEAAGSADKITVINYAFAIPAPDDSGQIIATLVDPHAAYQQRYTASMSIDGIADTVQQRLCGHFNQLRKLKSRHPQIRLLVSLGGWTGSTYFSDAALTSESRRIFVRSCIDMFILGDLFIDQDFGGPGVAAGLFDGIDIDWEYPISGGDAGTHHHMNDDVNFSALLQLFRSELDAINPGLLLTAATPAVEVNARKYRISHDQQYLNWFLLMTYDFHGAWESMTNHHSNLITSADDPSADAEKYSMDACIRLYRDTYGVPAHKLIPGAAFYGRGWKRVRPENQGLYQSGVPANGIYEQGVNSYRDLMTLLDQGYRLSWDDKALAASLYSPVDSVFWTFDDARAIVLKAKYADAYGLRGIMFWEISGDDPQGILVNSLFTRSMPDR